MKKCKKRKRKARDGSRRAKMKCSRYAPVIRKKRKRGSLARRKRKRRYGSTTKLKRPKYVHVVRKKKDREDMIGDPCPECLRFYKASGLWKEGDDEHNRKLLNQCSRHRHVKNHTPPPSTPPGFWDINFFTSEEED